MVLGVVLGGIVVDVAVVVVVLAAFVSWSEIMYISGDRGGADNVFWPTTTSTDGQYRYGSD